MVRHILGEDLKVGANLTWGPCFDYQKQFFTGKDDVVSAYPYLLRYDVEVSGFGSHRSGHLCLLRLREQMYPGGDSKNHWPTLCLNTLRWAKAQGALVGPAHSGWGLNLPTGDLPSYDLPPFNGIGANEYIMNVTHTVPGPNQKPVPAVDFLSMVDTPYAWELNIWYHTLNVGFRTRISGETDFPCIYGEKVGLGRSYVKLPAKWTYEDWCEGIRAGNNYVSDGKSHIMDMSLNFKPHLDAAGRPFAARLPSWSGVPGERNSEFKITRPEEIRIVAKVAARLNDQPDDALRSRPDWDRTLVIVTSDHGDELGDEDFKARMRAMVAPAEAVFLDAKRFLPHVAQQERVEWRRGHLRMGQFAGLPPPLGRSRRARRWINRAHVGFHHTHSPHGFVHGGTAQGGELIGGRAVGAGDVAKLDEDVGEGLAGGLVLVVGELGYLAAVGDIDLLLLGKDVTHPPNLTFEFILQTIIDGHDGCGCGLDLMDLVRRLLEVALFLVDLTVQLPDPKLDQPAEPGVGIVEVYEIVR